MLALSFEILPFEIFSFEIFRAASAGDSVRRKSREASARDDVDGDAVTVPDLAGG